MSDKKPALEKLPVLKDDPLFWGTEDFDPSRDAFNHEAYSKAIFNILAENTPPLSIGLFGPWGIGKSTVISILFKLIAQAKDCRLKPLFFNAWKYSGDSFRRQLLIEVARQVYEGHSELDAKILRLEQLNYTDVFREDSQKRLIDQVKSIFGARVRLREPGVARILLAIIVLIVGCVFAAFDKSVYPFVSSLFAALLLFFLRLKFEDLFVIQESPVYDPKLIFPEQFEAEFKKLISPLGPIGANRPVVVIDDIDRCDAATVRDILISIKTFVGQQNCFFIIPCDDKSIVQVFQDPNQKRGYEDELLRKYFNVGVRIAPLMATDLVDFANSVSRRTEMPGSVVQIAILANYRDARKMKHFLNTFAVKYAIAKARQNSGFMPVDIDQNLQSFAKAVLIEDLFPELFAKMVEHPEIYEAIERSALGLEAAATLKKFGLEKWDSEYVGLKSILEKTRDIRIGHIEVFLSLKTTNPEAKIPRGWELKNSVVQGDKGTIDEILKEVSTDAIRSALAELLIDLLDKTTDTFLKNTIAAALTCYFTEGMVAVADKPRLARDISHALVYREDQRVLQLQAQQTLQCATDAGGTLGSDLFEKYQRELAELEQPPDGMEETINTLFQKATKKRPISEILNKKFEQWCGTDRGLSILTKVQSPSDLKIEERLPSYAVLEKIAVAVSPDAMPAALNGNLLRKQILFKYWDERLSPILAERLFGILQQGLTDKEFSPRLAFAVDSIVENGECLEPKFSPQIWPLVREIYTRHNDEIAKTEIHKAILMFAAKCPVAAEQQEARNFALQNWQTFTDPQLRRTLEYLSTLVAGEELQTALVQQEFATMQNEIKNPTERTKQRIDLCYEHRNLLGAQSMETFLVKALESPDNAFSVWRVTIAAYCKKIDQEFSREIVERCLNLVTGSYSQRRRQSFMELFVEVLPIVTPDARPQFLQSYFALCEYADGTIRNPAASIFSAVRKSVDEQDFKLGLNTLVRDICRMAPTEVANYRPVLDGAMEHSVLFGDYEWRDLGDLSKRSIQQVDADLQGIGLLFIERMPKIPSEHESDLIHLLVAIARGANATHKDRADKILRKIPASDLSPTTRDALQEFLSHPITEEKEKPTD
jgi:KAP-like P-loop domain-containing protein